MVRMPLNSVVEVAKVVPFATLGGARTLEGFNDDLKFYTSNHRLSVPLD